MNYKRFPRLIFVVYVIFTGCEKVMNTAATLTPFLPDLPAPVSGTEEPVSKNIRLKHLNIIAHELDGPKKVHLVIVYEKKLLNILTRQSSDAYFLAHKQLIRDYPDMVEIIRWEVMSKRTFLLQKIRYKRSTKPVGVFVFIDYDNNQVNRWRVGSYANMIVTLNQDEAEVREMADK